jgi:transcriptional regulator with XRE-family HTH domain
LLTKLYVIMMSVILKTIRISRIEKNLTQEVVAKKLNFTQSYYAKMENGKADITLQNLLKLIEVLEVDYFIFQKRIERRIQENDI